MIDPPAPTRRAVIQDEPELFRLLVDLHRHNNNGWGFPYDFNLVTRRIEAATRQPGAGRTNPGNQLMGSIGVIGPVGGPLVASVGIFMESFFWYTAEPAFVEIWAYVRPEARHQARYHRALFAYSRWVHEHYNSLITNPVHRMPLFTGFVHMAASDRKIPLYERLWASMSGARKVGVLFVRH